MPMVVYTEEEVIEKCDQAAADAAREIAEQRDKAWLRNHECSWCGATLWMALRSGCRAMGEKCDLSKKNFGPDAMGRRTVSDPGRPVPPHGSGP